MRRYAPMKPSRGTVIPSDIRKRVIARDRGCIGYQLLPGDCAGPLELDHVRASGGMGMKSETSELNLVALCGVHHRYKTDHGREARPVLLDYLKQSCTWCQDYGDGTEPEPCPTHSEPNP